jgi:hypothetical protein
LSQPIAKLSTQADDLQATLDLAVRLGQERNAWPIILSALNDKIPEGVWITQMIPAFDPTREAAGAGVRAGRNGRSGPGGRRDSQNDAFRSGPAVVSPLLGSFSPPTNQINVLIINGLYHSNEKTEKIESTRLGEFVQALSELPEFDIDPKKTSETLISFTTSETDPTSFAQKFSMHLKLKEPIDLQP